MTKLSVSTVAILLCALTVPASADLRITRDHGGYLDEYKAKYACIRDSRERITIDGICNGACTAFLGIVPLDRVCVTPRASLGFKAADSDRQKTAGFWTTVFPTTSVSATDELMSLYPQSVKNWISRQGGLSVQMKYLKNGPDLWAIVNPCPQGSRFRAAVLAFNGFFFGRGFSANTRPRTRARHGVLLRRALPP